MDIINASRIAALVGALALAASCTSTREDGAGLEASPAQLASAEEEGAVPDYCPNVSLREGTAILRKGEGEAQQYIASIVSTSRSCRVLNGELRMKIGIAGRVVRGPAAKPGEVGLPIRVAVVRGTEVLYSKVGASGVTIQPGGTAEQFVYIDDAVVVPEPDRKNLVIYAGFDEGPERR